VPSYCWVVMLRRRIGVVWPHTEVYEEKNQIRGQLVDLCPFQPCSFGVFWSVSSFFLFARSLRGGLGVLDEIKLTDLALLMP